MLISAQISRGQRTSVSLVQVRPWFILQLSVSFSRISLIRICRICWVQTCREGLIVRPDLRAQLSFPPQMSHSRICPWQDQDRFLWKVLVRLSWSTSEYYCAQICQIKGTKRTRVQPDLLERFITYDSHQFPIMSRIEASAFVYVPTLYVFLQCATSVSPGDPSSPLYSLLPLFLVPISFLPLAFLFGATPQGALNRGSSLFAVFGWSSVCGCNLLSVGLDKSDR